MRGFGKRRGGKILLLFVILVLLVWGMIGIDQKLTPIVESIAETRAHLAVTRIVNQAVAEQTGNGLSYQDLVTVEKDTEGKISLIQPDTIKINQLMTAITADIESGLSSLASEGVEIPAGLLSGLTLLADMGPAITVGIQPIAAVDVNLENEFIAVGVNQSKHSLSLATRVTVNVIVPFSKKVMEIDNRFPLTESIIVGPIPNTYLDWN